MSTPGGIASGLALLSQWLDANAPAKLEQILPPWLSASGWKSAGLVWPANPSPTVALLAQSSGVTALSTPPAEYRDVAGTLIGGSPTTVWQLPNSMGRLYTRIQPAGQAPGLLWAERAADPWTDADRSYLHLSAKLLERSPAFTKLVGPVLDPQRLEQRLADASLIAGRMAHDFDNILTGIIGFADLTVPQLPADSQPAKFVAEIGKVGQRGIVFTQQLHQLSRSGHTKPQPGIVAAALFKEENRVRPTLPTGATLRSIVAGGMGPVAMEASPLGIVLGHLLDNAAEALGPNGAITVTAMPVDLTSADAANYLGAATSGPHTEITVTDNGTGIKPDVRARLFAEPFYTTKVRHRGLGLAIVFRTLLAHRGGVRIDAAAPPDIGTIARVVIPVAANRPAIVAAA